jgi:starvation-inducible DNA-binding protein
LHESAPVFSFVSFLNYVGVTVTDSRRCGVGCERKNVDNFVTETGEALRQHWGATARVPREKAAMRWKMGPARGDSDQEADTWSSNASSDIAAALNAALADMFTLYFKTKNFDWHVTGAQFGDCHRLFREQAAEILAATDSVAERVRKIGKTTIRSVPHIARLARLCGNEQDGATSEEMLAELHRDNERLAESLREAHLICADYDDVASTMLLGALIDHAEKRCWMLLASMPQR